MSYCGYVTMIKYLHKHPNADRLLLGECFGNTVCVSTDYAEGEIGIYFPTDGQLSVEFAEQNNLLRKKDENGNNIGGYMDPDKRNVTSIRLRGEKSDGLFLPISCIAYTGVDLDTINVGDTITVVNGHDICQKYIPRGRRSHSDTPKGNRVRKKKVPIAPLFVEHADTEQLAYNLDDFHSGDQIEITLKMHGTSQRTAYLPKLQGYKKTLWDKIRGKEGTPVYDWGYVTGTRRTVIDNYDGGYYGSNEFREEPAKCFEGKLHKGEAVYYEVVGFTNSGQPIMGNASNKKLNDKDFIRQYGETTCFSYGCSPNGKSAVFRRESDGELTQVLDKVPQCDFYVYRMTMTNEDGDVVEYTPDFMRYRCEQMGVKCVPLFAKLHVIDNFVAVLETHSAEAKPTSIEVTSSIGEAIRHIAEWFYDGPDPVGKTHVREGVVVRIVNRPKFTAYKHKNFSFKVLEGIIKDTAEAPDMEEAEELIEENQE